MYPIKKAAEKSSICIGREKQNFCVYLYTMRGPFPLWSQLNSQVKACNIKLCLGLHRNLRLNLAGGFWDFGGKLYPNGRNRAADICGKEFRGSI